MLEFFKKILFNSKEKHIKLLKSRGLLVGKNFSIQQGCIIDPDHCWHIQIGDNVTLAPRVHILAHDASSFIYTHHTKVRNVIIGNNVFIGAGSIIMPGVSIVDDVVIGAGTVVYKSINQDGVYVGPALRRVYSIEQYKEKLKTEMKSSKLYDSDYTLRNPKFNSNMKKEMNDELILKGLIFIE